MKTLDKFVAASLCAIATLCSPLAQASLINNADGTFTDTGTGYRWLSLNQTDGLTFAQAAAGLPAGFHVASTDEVAGLIQDAPAASGNFAADAAAMGLADGYSVIWGFYGDSGHVVWKEDWNDDAWSSNAANAYGWTNYDYALPSDYASPGLSLFAANTTPSSQVPEPATLALVGLGAIGLGLRRRSRDI